MPGIDMQNYIHKIELDEKLVLRRAGMVEAERAAAIRDILEKNSFQIPDNNHGPYYVRIGIDGHRLHLRIRDCLRNELPNITLSLMPFRRLIKDYFLICESYQLAHVAGDPARLETIDMARRSLHNEGAGILRERIADRALLDHDTARALFTLLCVLHIGSVQPW